jgi:uncharacterized membrane protein (DUF2068 family)
MHRPPVGLIALSGFFAFGAVISGLTEVALLTPGGGLERMWQLNPQAHEALLSMGPWAIALMGTVSLACGLAARGLWCRARWGYRLALTILAVNLLGDVGNLLLHGDPRTLLGLPIGAGLIAYLLRARVRAHFRTSTAA